jgi:hypothetical protein
MAVDSPANARVQHLGVDELCMRMRQHLVEAPLFGIGFLAHGVVGADQQVADRLLAGVARGRHRHHGRQPRVVTLEVREFIDVLDAFSGLEHQRREARRDADAALVTEFVRAQGQLLRVRQIGRGRQVDHVGGGVAQHPFGASVEQLDRDACIGRDAREAGALQDGRLRANSSTCQRAPSASVQRDRT